MDRQIDDKIIPGSPNLPTSEAVKRYADDTATNLDQSWALKHIEGDLPPHIGLAVDGAHENRLAFMPASGIYIEYSRDGGNTWSNYTDDVNRKRQLVTTSDSFSIGAKSSDITTNDKLRITITALEGYVYTASKALAINISTNGAIGSKVLVEKAYTIEGGISDWDTQGTYSIGGWSGWNCIPTNYAFGGGSTQYDQCRKIRLTFSISDLSSKYSSALTVYSIQVIGTTAWHVSSNLARWGHIYSVDISQSTTFPSDIHASNIYASSDLRLKDNIQDNTFDLLSILDKIKIKQFIWKTEKDKNNQNVGVIAQELQKILPQELQKEFVIQNSDGYYSVNDSKLVYLLIDAYQQEKQKRIELENRIKVIEDKLEV